MVGDNNSVLTEYVTSDARPVRVFLIEHGVIDKWSTKTVLRTTSESGEKHQLVRLTDAERDFLNTHDFALQPFVGKVFLGGSAIATMKTISRFRG